MTVENCIKLLEIYKAQMTNPNLKAPQQAQSKLNYENMKAHILNPNSRKFKDTPIQKQLMEEDKPKPQKVEAEEPKPKGGKSGKKRKG